MPADLLQKAVRRGAETLKWHYLMPEDPWRYCLMPEDRRYELIEGEFYLVPSPRVIHRRIAANLEAILRGYVKEKDCGEVLDVPLTPGTECGNSGWSTPAPRQSRFTP